MAKKRLHRIAVYVMDSDRKRIMLQMQHNGPFINQYYVPHLPINDQETPLETGRRAVTTMVDIDFVWLGHGPAMPILLDERAVKIFPPLHVQVTAAEDYMDFVDYVCELLKDFSDLFETCDYIVFRTAKSARSTNPFVSKPYCSHKA